VDTAFSFALVSLPARQILPALSWARFVRSPVMAKSGHFCSSSFLFLSHSSGAFRRQIG
jgi:hypothetical protein